MKFHEANGSGRGFDALHYLGVGVNQHGGSGVLRHPSPYLRGRKSR
jgi:hypothetical protein